MKILAIETCFGKFSLAIFAGGNLLGSFASDEENKQAEKLMPAIEDILAQNKLPYKDLDAVAVAIGPGSFTGIRIGMAAAKGIAFAAGIKLIGISTLEAAAEKKGGWPVHLNAARGDAFFQRDADTEPVLLPYEGKFDEVPDAINIGHVAINHQPSTNIEPLYVRKPDAKLPAVKIMANIHARCFDKAWRQEEFQNLDYILEGEKGFVAYKTVIDECEIKTICVLPEFRKQGVAAQLMARMLEKAGARKIFLEVDEKNLAAINLYKNLGFEHFSTRKAYYANGNDALLMQKTIAI